MLNEVLLVALASLVALAVGSFLNVVIYRLPQMLLYPNQDLTLISPRSRCPNCQSKILLRDNVPLISWLALRGRCRHCKSPISVRYPITELATLMLSLVLAGLLPWNLTLVAALLLCWMLLPLVLIDIQHQLLPDILTLSLLWLGLLCHTFSVIPGTLSNAVLGAVAGYLLLWLIATVYRSWKGIAGLGLGDAKLLAALGAWLGWQALPRVLLIAATSGIVYVLLRYAFFHRSIKHPLPFGPMLAFAGVMTFIPKLMQFAEGTATRL
ncbi:prepilin peptidase [Pantoea sp.]|uniref:prepilin peptidase n=1 Tax=Pantoea sp. TaxID=69393 RepID=UPI0031DA23C9